MNTLRYAETSVTVSTNAEDKVTNIRSSILGKFRNMVLEEDGEDQLDRSREK